jgi:hypothetical protein
MSKSSWLIFRLTSAPRMALTLDPALRVWWDEEFANALGELPSHGQAHS